MNSARQLIRTPVLDRPRRSKSSAGRYPAYPLSPPLGLGGWPDRRRPWRFAVPKRGVVSLAHDGVLCLDELPEFEREVLEVMRQPLEDGQLTLSRATASLTHPACCTLVTAMRPRLVTASAPASRLEQT
jgi:hypothetical protein